MCQDLHKKFETHHNFGSENEQTSVTKQLSKCKYHYVQLVDYTLRVSSLRSHIPDIPEIVLTFCTKYPGHFQCR